MKAAFYLVSIAPGDRRGFLVGIQMRAVGL